MQEGVHISLFIVVFLPHHNVNLATPTDVESSAQACAAIQVEFYKLHVDNSKFSLTLPQCITLVGT